LEKGEGTPLEKVSFFLDLFFLLNGFDNLPSNSKWTQMCVFSFD
jgi:hypothetical protein